MHNDWTHVPVDYSDVLRRAMDSLFKTFENFSEGTFIVDKDARVVWINKRYAARFGFSDPQEAIGRDCEAVIPNSLMREVVTTGKPILLADIPGEKQPQTVAWAVERADGGRGFGFCGGHFHSNWGILDFRRMVVNAILWTAKVNVPSSGAKCDVSSEDLLANQDVKAQK